MDTLGYESWPSFLGVINKAMASCSRLNIDATEAFTAEIIEHNGRPLRTFRLSRFACFLVSMHADSKKPQVAKAKAALAAIADQLIQHHINEQDLGRLEARQDLRLAESVMSGVAKAAGLESTQFGIFKDAGFRGMYNMGLRQLMRYKGVPDGQVLYDFMGLDELAGNLFRVTQTAARVKAQKVAGLQNLSDTAASVGSEVREMMVKNSGLSPESLPIEEPIAGVQKRLKTAARAMKKLDAKKEQSGRRQG